MHIIALVMSLVRRVFHPLLGHSWQLVGYSVMGAPIYRCSVCDQYSVCYGSIGDFRHPLTEKEAMDIMGDILP